MQFSFGRRTASIVSYAALTLILTAGAAQSLTGTNTVFSNDIAPGGVATSDIRDSAIGGKKIISNSVPGTDIRANTLGPREINARSLIYRSENKTQSITNDGNTYSVATLPCETGDIAIAGEISVFAGMEVESSQNSSGADPGTMWTFSVRNPTAADHNANVNALCLRDTP